MLVNGEPVDAFSSIVHRDKADARGRSLAAKARKVILPSFIRSPFKRLGGKIIARENVSALRKERNGEMLWRGYYKKKKAIRKAKGR